jgi:uncharacterized protein with HEPN domain
MADRPEKRVADIKKNVAEIRHLLAGRSLGEIEADSMRRAAFERFLEVISEASRYLPDSWKAEHPDIAWRRISDLGNVIRHVYERVDLSILWGIYERDLAPLESAVDAMLIAHGTKDPSP